MAQTLTLARPARNLRPYLWLALPLLVLATLFFYPLLLIAEQALRDASGNLSLETFWQVIDSKRFIGALLNTLQIAVFATLGCLVLGSVLALILVFIPFPGSQLVSRVIDTFIALPTFLITLAFTFIYGSAGLLNDTLMALFAFELPPVDFLYSINGVILAEITVFTPLALRQYGATLQKYLGLAFYLPSAIPSVSVGLGILVAFSQGPLQMNGTFFIVLAAHFVLISAFTFSNVTTGLARISADIENVASSLGASPWYRLRHVTLPLMTPWMISALALSLSLSMGELGATVMIYPPGWTTLPVTIFSLTDRGNIADGSALTIVLVGVTLLLMMKLERIARRLSQR